MGAFISQRSGDVYRLVVDRARLLGARWVREEFTATRLHQGPEMPYYWAPYDRVVDAERRDGLSVLGLLDYSNSWGYADHGVMPHGDMRRTSAEFAQYAYAVARHFRGRITYWQVWNEPNLTMFWHPHTDPADYARLLSAAYRSIKRANPRARVVLAGTSGFDLDFIRQVASHTHDFDVVSVHPYRTLPEPRLLGQIEALGQLRRPIWFSEIGWAAGDGCDQCTDDDVQAAYLVRFYALSAAAGVQRVFWYDLRDDSNDPASPEAHFGLLRRDLSGKPSFAAYAYLARLLQGAKFLGASATGEGGLYALSFRAGPRPFTIAWNTASFEQKATVPWPAPSAVTLDIDGNWQASETVKGRRATFPVPPGGRPVYLAADTPAQGPGMPAALLHPPPPPRASHSVRPSVRTGRASSSRRGRTAGGRVRAVGRSPNARRTRPANLDPVHVSHPHRHARRREHGFGARPLPAASPTVAPSPVPTGTPSAGTTEETLAATPDPSPSPSAAAMPSPTAESTRSPEAQVTPAVTLQPEDGTE